MEAKDIGKTAENVNHLADSDEMRMDALRMLFRNKYVQQKPDLIGQRQNSDAPAQKDV